MKIELVFFIKIKESVSLYGLEDGDRIVQQLKKSLVPQGYQRPDHAWGIYVLLR